MSRVRAPSPAFISRRFRFFRSAFFISAAYERSCRGGSRTRREKVKRFAERVAHRAQESETLCRKGGTSRSDNAPLASRACAGAKLACGATLSATREFVTFAWGLSSHFLTVFFYVTASSCKLVKRNSRASNKPRSLNFSAGIGSNAKKLRVINGALNVAPTSWVIVS